MTGTNPSRRGFFSAAGAGALTAASLSDPGRAAAQAAGVKPADFPDLTIKEVKVYVLKPTESNNGQGGANYLRTEKIASVTTNSGIEGNYDIPDRFSHPNWTNLGWLAYAKRALVGKQLLDLPEFTSQWRSPVGQLSYAST